MTKKKMKLDENKQKIIYEFLKVTTESLNGFKSYDNKKFIPNKNLMYPNVKPDPSTKPLSVHSHSNESENLLVTTQPNSNLGTINQATLEVLNNEELWKLSQAKYDVENCSKCDLSKTRKKSVFGEGVFDFVGENEIKHRPAIMVIGEGPGHDEDVTGRPFVGRAGQLLDKMLIAIGLSRHTNCYICNVVKCRPPNNRQPTPDEMSACLPFLHSQIQILKPKLMLLMGRTACHALLDTSEGMHRLHGRFFDLDGTPAMCTYHPSALLHNEALKRPAWEDLKIFRKRIHDMGID